MSEVRSGPCKQICTFLFILDSLCPSGSVAVSESLGLLADQTSQSSLVQKFGTDFSDLLLIVRNAEQTSLAPEVREPPLSRLIMWRQDVGAVGARGRRGRIGCLDRPSGCGSRTRAPGTDLLCASYVPVICANCVSATYVRWMPEGRGGGEIHGAAVRKVGACRTRAGGIN